MTQLGKAIAIAAAAHQDQLDKNELPYILHPIRMMLKMDSEEEMTVAVLHDIIEDTSWTLDQLRDEGFPDQVIKLIALLSRNKGESYADFIQRIQADPTAVKIKLADLEDNMDTRRVLQLSEKDISRLKRYHKYWGILREGSDV